MQSISDLTLSSFSQPLDQELACGKTLICSSPAKSVQWCTRKCVEQLTGGLSLARKSISSAIEGRNPPSPRIQSTYVASPGPPRKGEPSSKEQLRKFKRANGGIISIRTLFGQWVLQENELCDDEGPGNPSGGSFGGGQGGHDGSMDGFFPLPEGGNAYFLVLLGRIFRGSVSVAGVKLIIPALLVHCLLYININAHAEAIASPAKTPLNTAKIEENAQEAKLHDSEDGSTDAVFELRGGHWRRFLINVEKDEFVIDPVKKKEGEKFVLDEHSGEDTLKPTQGLGLELFVGGAERSARWCWDLIRKLMLPEGYPESVTGDYLEYTLWRMGQGIASQINGVLTTQALLYAVGLGKGAIPTAAAVNWVLKDGIGYLSKILLAKYGRHFDVHPKGWRLLADLIENASCGLELLTPAFPHLFVYLGAAGGAGRSAAGLIQAATRSCFYAGFAAQRNFAEVIAKGEAQGMVSKSLGIMLGIAISGYVGSSGPLLVATFIGVTGAHMVCNLRSYQAVQLRTLNPYRASLVFGEYIRRGVVASVEEVNAEEPIFTEVPFLKFRLKGQKGKYDVLSSQTKEDAAVLANKLKLGVTFGNVIRTQQEADALFNIYQDEQYVLAERQSEYQVLLKMRATSHDLLRMMLQVCYLYQLQCSSDLNDGGALETSYKYMADRFERVQQDLVSSTWVTSDGLVSRPLPYRLLESIPVNPVFS